MLRGLLSRMFWPLVVAACLVLPFAANAGWQSRDSNYNVNVVSGGGGGGCATSVTFLARTSGLNGTETGAYQGLICGLVTDGVITGNLGTTGCGSKLDGLYVFATNTTTTALLNLCGTAYGLTSNGTLTFTADQGYTTNGATGSFLATGYNLSSRGASSCGNGAATCNFAITSGTLASYGLTSRTTTQAWSPMGAYDGTNITQMFPYLSGASNTINALTGLAETLTNANGMSILTRTGVTTTNFYHYNGSALPTTTASGISANTIPNATLSILGRNNSGSTDVNTQDLIAFAAFGGGLSLSDSTALATRMNAFLLANGAHNVW